jgi:hypothetical protein
MAREARVFSREKGTKVATALTGVFLPQMAQIFASWKLEFLAARRRAKNAHSVLMGTEGWEVFQPRNTLNTRKGNRNFFTADDAI